MVEREDKRLYALYRKLVLWTLLVLGGLILWVLSGDQRNAFIQPGTLTASHAGIKQCDACHSAANLGIKGWINAALNDPTQHDTKLCLNCHELGEFPEFAHSVAPDVVAGITADKKADRSEQTLLVKSAKRLGWAPQSGARLECKSCHQEHSGNHQLITADSAEHCQSCHSQSFTSFEDGHPEFSEYPFRERTAINFDHVSHINKHFNEEPDAPASCLSCHTTRNQGNEMSTLSFEQTCASCHSEDIRGDNRATASGFDILRVPGLDTDTLRERRIFIGQWPEHADDTLSPLMELLLQSDAHYATVRPILGTTDLMDLRAASDEQLKAVATLAWCVKMLLNDVIEGGTGFLQMRLEKALGRPLSHAQIAPLLATLPKPVIQSASAAWFPALETDMEHHLSGKEYWPENPQSEDIAKSSIASTDAAPMDDTDLGDSSLFGDESLFDDEQGLWGESEDEPSTAQLAISSEQWAKYGGWYRDDLALYYRPVGHADGFLRHWLELSANVSNANALFAQLSDPEAPGQCTQCHSIDQLPAELEHESGQTTKVRTINWLSRSSASLHSFGERKFTHFRHIPHLTLQGDDGCQSCHALNADNEYADSFKDFNPNSFSSNFSTMEKTSCDSCHNRSVENQDCLSCHQYHAGELSPVIKSLGL